MKYFTIEELCRSNTAKYYNIDNTPTKEVEANLIELVSNVLDPAREFLGKPIHINSGFRCEILNSHSTIRGAKNSQHVEGKAADIKLGRGSKKENKVLFEWIKDNCKFDQLIWEKGGAWVHVSFNKKNNRKQVFSLP